MSTREQFGDTDDAWHDEREEQRSAREEALVEQLWEPEELAAGPGAPSRAEAEADLAVEKRGRW